MHVTSWQFRYVSAALTRWVYSTHAASTSVVAGSLTPMYSGFKLHMRGSCFIHQKGF